MYKNKIIMLLLFLLVSLSLADIPQGFTFVKEDGGIEEYKMESNGLRVLLMEDHTAPVLTFMVTFHVGSRNEVTGTTGATHILEHLMFKGTEKYNKANDSHIDNLLGNIGARLNATTWTDRTNYYESIPSNYLELAIDIESDRMRNLLLRAEDRDAEMTVVRNEYERGENNPYYAVDKEIFATAFQAHPYHHSTIGWRSDIENVPIEKLRDFYDTFYWPNNATVTIIGDFDKSNALSLIKQYYGAIPAADHEIPRLYTEEPKQEGARRVIVKRPGQTGVVGIGWKSPSALHEDTYALTVLDNILSSGKNSRYYKALIDKNKSISSWNDHSLFADPSLFIAYSYLAPGITHEEVEKVILEEIEKVKTEGVSSEEVQRAISQIAAETIYDRDGSFSVASELNESIARGDWTFFTRFLDNIKKVTAQQVKEVANKYFIEEHSTTGYFIPVQAGGAEEKPGPSSFSKGHPKYFFRTPGNQYEAGAALHSTMPESQEESSMAENISRSKIHGIDLITAKTGVKGMVSFSGSMAAGDIFSPKGSPMLADLTGRMLDKGTTKNDKFALAEKLESIGATLSIGVGKNNVTFNGRCLKKDVPVVTEILAEQLRYPAFSEEELGKLKTQIEGSLKRRLEDTESQASEEFSRIIFNKDHPNYDVPTKELIESLAKVTVADIQAFYKEHYGPKTMIMVFAGDIDNKNIHDAFDKTFAGWNGGMEPPAYQRQVDKADPGTHYVTIEGKTSVAVVMGQNTGLKRSDADYLPLSMANMAFGGSFAARLMSIVRDDEGLTYGIYSYHDSDIYTDGRWYVEATFAPNLLNKGLQSTTREIKRFVNDGLTEKEFEAAKTRMTGSYKVNLVTSSAMAGQILSFVQRGFDISYMDEYPRLLQQVTLKQVNDVIKKYIDPESIVTVIAGSVDQEGKPLGQK